MKINTDAIKRAIEIAGGANALAQSLGVAYQTVLAWKNARSSISLINCKKIEEVTHQQVKLKDILPDFPWEG